MKKELFLLFIFLSSLHSEELKEKNFESPNGIILEDKQIVTSLEIKNTELNTTLEVKNIDLNTSYLIPPIEKKNIENHRIINIKLIEPYPVNSIKSINSKNFINYNLFIDTNDNYMFLIGKKNNRDYELLTTFLISSAKKSKEKPIGVGTISEIDLNPIWCPTKNTRKDFLKRKKIELPKMIPYGDKLNYMGDFKMILTHNVNGNYVYRIHGTKNENTIGRHETGGCIRMKNIEGKTLAEFLKKELNRKKVIVEII